MTTTIGEWNERFSVSGVAQVVAGQGGLAMVRVTAPTASAEIYLHGAQVTSWCPVGGNEVLFLSAESRGEDGKAIRGGIPICFPWFRGKGDGAQAPAPAVERLELELTVINTGWGALRFEEALHTYHGVGDAKKIRVTGLDGTAYRD